MAVKVNENVFIGSKNRLLFPTRKLFRGATLFVEPKEYKDYSLFYKGSFKIIKLEKDDMGFGYMLNSMLSYAKNNKISHYFFCDDDILGFSFRTPKSNILQEMEMMRLITEKNGYSQLMMSFKAHNWFCKKLIKEKIGAWCFILNKTNDLISVGGYDEKLKIYNDWEMSAKLIKSGKKTACYYGAMFSHKMKSLEGGAFEIYKKQKNLDEAKAYLQDKYGSDVLREVEIHNQKEIRFYWSKL